VLAVQVRPTLCRLDQHKRMLAVVAVAAIAAMPLEVQAVVELVMQAVPQTLAVAVAELAALVVLV
jgi:hypothetical protein